MEIDWTAVVTIGLGVALGRTLSAFFGALLDVFAPRLR